jgi:uncharacterized protein
MKRFDLRSLRFDERDEAWRQLPVDVDPFVFGGAQFAVRDGTVDLDLEAARVGDRVTLTGFFETVLQGPCERCLEPAEVPFDLRGTEVALHGESEGDDEEERYVRRHFLDADRWIRDLIGAALPSQILCREECRGLCPICGANLNEAPDHEHQST